MHDADQNGLPYIKRFLMDATRRKQSYLGDNPKSRRLLLTDEPYPRLKITFAGRDPQNSTLEIDVESFIAVKGFKAKGKRIGIWQVENVEMLEPKKVPEDAAVNAEGGTEEDKSTVAEEPKPENLDPDAGKTQQQVIDEITGQLSLFNDEDL